MLSLTGEERNEKHKKLENASHFGGGEYVFEPVAAAASGGVGGGDDVNAAAPAAGKVVWANEGFERLAGVDMVDFVGRRLGSLLEVLGVGQGEDLTRSFKLGTVSFRRTQGTHMVGVLSFSCFFS